MTTAALSISIRRGTDMTGPAPVEFPEVRIAGTEAGLRLLRRQITWVIRSARRSPGVHTHITGRDGPDVAADPAGLMLTIEHLPDRPARPATP